MVHNISRDVRSSVDGRSSCVRRDGRNSGDGRSSGGTRSSGDGTSSGDVSRSDGRRICKDRRSRHDRIVHWIIYSPINASSHAWEILRRTLSVGKNPCTLPKIYKMY